MIERVQKLCSSLLIEFAGFAFGGLRFSLRLLPPKLMLSLTAQIAAFIGSLQGRELAISRAQLSFAFPGGDPRKDTSRKQTTKERLEFYQALPGEVFKHAGELLGETLIFDLLLSKSPNQESLREFPQYQFIQTDSQAELRKIRDSGRGAVFLSSHLGCYELLAAFIIEQLGTMSVIARKPNYPRLAERLDKLRLSYGAELIWRHDPSGAKKLLKAFKDNKVIAALVDQDTDVQYQFSPFFGLEAAVPIAPIKFAVSRDLPIYTAFIARTSRMNHKIWFEQINYGPEDSGAVQEVIDVYNQRLESLIRRYPEQWWWWHRRWRRRPGVDYSTEPERLRSTNDYLNWLKQQSPTNL